MMSVLGGFGLKAITAVLRSRSYDIRQVGQPPRGFAEFLAFAKRCGVAPCTVFDM